MVRDKPDGLGRSPSSSAAQLRLTASPCRVEATAFRMFRSCGIPHW